MVDELCMFVESLMLNCSFVNVTVRGLVLVLRILDMYVTCILNTRWTNLSYYVVARWLVMHPEQIYVCDMFHILMCMKSVGS
jgi:hypothetical protein